MALSTTATTATTLFVQDLVDNVKGKFNKERLSVAVEFYWNISTGAHPFNMLKCVNYKKFNTIFFAFTHHMICYNLNPNQASETYNAIGSNTSCVKYIEAHGAEALIASLAISRTQRDKFMKYIEAFRKAIDEGTDDVDISAKSTEIFDKNKLMFTEMKCLMRHVFPAVFTIYIAYDIGSISATLHKNADFTPGFDSLSTWFNKLEYFDTDGRTATQIVESLFESRRQEIKDLVTTITSASVAAWSNSSKDSPSTGGILTTPQQQTGGSQELLQTVSQLQQQLLMQQQLLNKFNRNNGGPQRKLDLGFGSGNGKSKPCHVCQRLLQGNKISNQQHRDAVVRSMYGHLANTCIAATESSKATNNPLPRPFDDYKKTIAEKIAARKARQAGNAPS